MGPETDRLALLALKDKLTNGNPQVLPSWNSSLHFCKWEGVSCSAPHIRVSKLQLAGPSFDGSLAPAIGNLTFLKLINITFTRVHGEIPKEIGRLKRLQVLFLRLNNIQGEIPIELANCSNLQLVVFNRNNLTGKIPPWLGSMRSLNALHLDVNKFSGSIPESLGNLSSLRVLSLPGNNLQGSIPQTLGRLTSLSDLLLAQNNLSGIIPLSLYNLSNVVIFDLGSNHLFGTIPSNIDLSFPNVQTFWVGSNSLTGTIPPTFSNLSRLQSVDLVANRFSGPFPTSLGRLQNLLEMNIDFNILGSGSNGDLDFLSSLTNCSQLLTLSLQGNGFGGVLPESIGNFTSPLNTLLVGHNKISGSIPEEIGKLVGLTFLDMGGNLLQGEIPVSIGKLKNLGRTYFEKNQLSGNIPAVLGNLTKLFDLYLNNNNFEGSIPDAVRDCKNMQNLFLSKNKLSGNIPNDTFGRLEDLVVLNMSYNSLTGPLPSEFGNLKHLVELDVIENKLSGDIPIALGECSGLSLLFMNGNFFQGSIPSSFGLLKSLEFLDLSRNNLSGRIPNELKDLPFLEALNLSFNHLQGEVPKGGVFDHTTAIQLTGNEDLCGGIPELKLPACSNKPEKSFKTVVILIVVIGSAFICFVVSISIYWRRKPNGLSSSSSSMENWLFKVSYRELHDATNGFSSSNLVGSGSFGSVYRGTLHYYEKPIVVKVLNLQTRGASKSFANECKALSKVRHRNLLKVLTCCSSIDYKGGNFMALIFEFMPNGSLESWLSTNENGESRNLHLNFVQRLDIAIDVANALDYLHHDCEVAIVHCDIKLSNVLLDEDMVAHLGDFGLAKLLHEVTGYSSSDQTPSSAIKGTIGYIPPEYGGGGAVTPQGDIYSYGVLLLGLLTGKKPTDSMFGVDLSLHKFCKLALSDRITEIVDSSLLIPSQRGHIKVTEKPNVKFEIQESLISFAKIGVACSVDSPSERMGIKDVLVELLAIKKRLSPVGINSSMQNNLHSYGNSSGF
ncbi:probable LRR receptor-like serine/threonine-protein kinase At3g47570 [Neltuma alba]|uniref:probable LRR receptor-like serine/threonine-protein kinase At3g47570 n=1 Tax=Neltuma alba TaxID=207710 RepID=UPI0010A50BF9|nr:probable LRR receptor-like serine/threonine-protein kinase At3g47570 [Prosopis alba]